MAGVPHFLESNLEAHTVYSISSKKIRKFFVWEGMVAIVFKIHKEKKKVKNFAQPHTPKVPIHPLPNYGRLLDLRKDNVDRHLHDYWFYYPAGAVSLCFLLKIAMCQCKHHFAM